MIPIVTTRPSDKETNQVNRQNRSVTRLTAVVLVVGLVALASGACARHGSPSTLGSAGNSQAIQGTEAAPADSTVASDDLTSTSLGSPDASASGSTAASPTLSSSRTTAPAATPDPLDSELQALDQIVNDVNGSISGTDARASGGE